MTVTFQAALPETLGDCHALRSQGSQWQAFYSGCFYLICHCEVCVANCGNLLDAIETVLFKLPCLKLWEIATPCVARLAMTGVLFRLPCLNGVQVVNGLLNTLKWAILIPSLFFRNTYKMCHFVLHNACCKKLTCCFINCYFLKAEWVCAKNTR